MYNKTRDESRGGQRWLQLLSFQIKINFNFMCKNNKILKYIIY